MDLDLKAMRETAEWALKQERPSKIEAWKMGITPEIVLELIRMALHEDSEVR